MPYTTPDHSPQTYLHHDPSLAGPPEFSPEQLESLTRSIERKQQKLEQDIKQYIQGKQVELKNYEQELLAEHRSKQRPPPRNADSSSQNSSSSVSVTSSSTEPTETSPESTTLGPVEKAKRNKHTRVHKREKELLEITPYFLPLLEAGDLASPTKKKKEKKKQKEVVAEHVGVPPTVEQGSPTRDAENGKENRRSRSNNREEKMEHGEGVPAAADVTKVGKRADEGKKAKRTAVKKSSLRGNNTPRSRRKRVSLVIDDQIVLPADNIMDPPLTSPSETTLSTASNSSTSLNEIIDPRLTSHAHHDPVHHSIPQNTNTNSSHRHAPASASPPTYTEHTITASSPEDYVPPQTATRTFLDPSPSHPELNIPQRASGSPIYASEPEAAEADEEQFSTYVGGLSGSNVDDVDQAGSYGYPSSLGASYMESYMQSRPLSVRIAAAEKAGLKEEEKKRLLQGTGGDQNTRKEDEEPERRPRGQENSKQRRTVEDDDDDFEIMGEMDDF